jgi:hypothetical protein
VLRIFGDTKKNLESMEANKDIKSVKTDTAEQDVIIIATLCGLLFN